MSDEKLIKLSDDLDRCITDDESLTFGVDGI